MPENRIIVGIYEVIHRRGDHVYETRAKNVAILIHMRGLSVPEVATSIGRSSSTLYRLLKGEFNVSRAVLDDVAAFFYLPSYRLDQPLTLDSQFFNDYCKLEGWREGVVNLLTLRGDEMHYEAIHRNIHWTRRVKKKLWKKDVQARLRAMCDLGEIVRTRPGWYALP